MTERMQIIGEWQNSVYQKWASRYILNNLWRVSHAKGDYDDLMQEAAIEFILMKRDYADKVNSPQQFMSLYQLCLHSHINNISIKDSRNRATIRKIKDTFTPQDKRNEGEVIESFDRATVRSVVQDPYVRPDADINVILNESSNELKEVLKVFFNAPVEVMETLRNECKSYSPLQFFNRVLEYCGIPRERSKALIKELEDRLS